MPDSNAETGGLRARAARVATAARPAALTAVLALALGLAAYSPALAPDRQLAGGDLLAHFYPLGKRVAAQLRAGRPIPDARDPTRALGVPLAADPLAWSFYPPRVLHALVPYDLGFKLVLALHAAIAGAGASWLARAVGARGRARLLAVVATTLAGPLLSAHREPHLLASAAWAPWAAAASLEALGVRGRERVARLALASGFWALLFLAGGIEIALGLALALAIGASGATSLEGVANPWERRILEARAFLALAPAALLGLGLASLQVVPTALWLLETTRREALTDAQASVPCLEPARLLGLLARALDPGSGQEHRPGASSFPSLYLGAGVVACALAGVTVGGRRARALGLGALVALVVALGEQGRLFAALRRVPGLDRLAGPEKLVLVFAVLVPAVAARGACVLARRAPKRAWLVGVLLGVTALDLLTGRREVLRTIPRLWLETPPATIALVDTGRVLGESGLTEAHLGSEPATGDGFLAAKAHERTILAGGLAGIWAKESASLDVPLPPERLDRLLSLLYWDGRTWDLLGCSAVLADPDGVYRKRLPNFPEEARPGTCVSARQPVDVSRAWLASTVEWWERTGPLELGRCSPWSRGRRGPVAVVEGGRVPPLVEELSATRLDRSELDRVDVLERAGDRERVATLATGPRLLVLSELYTRGVRAHVDGHEAIVVPADIALVGVPVPAGAHEVVVIWTTPGILVGLLVSLACALGAAKLLTPGGARALEPISPVSSLEPTVSLRRLLLGAVKRAAPAPRAPRMRVYFRDSLAAARALPDEMFQLPPTSRGEDRRSEPP